MQTVTAPPATSQQQALAAAQAMAAAAAATSAIPKPGAAPAIMQPSVAAAAGHHTAPPAPAFLSRKSSRNDLRPDVPKSITVANPAYQHHHRSAAKAATSMIPSPSSAYPEQPPQPLSLIHI